ncbi:MAG: IS66 family transposase [Deltaproteobacteria bacterium]|nr:IS66 family transposase [Deltaproteobacteria bacterium]
MAVSKCADSIPLHRQARLLIGTGIPTYTSTLCDIFHRDASLLNPIAKRILQKIKESEYINANETRIGVQDGTTAYVWNFSTDKYVGHFFNQTRSEETPKAILGDSIGFLQVDQYSEYNQVTTLVKRNRVGCLAHMRRKLFEAKDVAPKDCKWMLEQIRELYIVEYDAAEANVLRGEQHLALRKGRSQSTVNDIKKWLEQNENRWGPKNKMGRAVR